MFYEFALISVVIASGWWGYYFLRHRPHGPVFGMMQMIAALFAGFGLVGRSYEQPVLGVLGAIGLGAGMCLLVLGPLVRGLARRFAAAERTGIASRLLDVAEILAPGSGVAEEKAVLGALKEIREGRVENTVHALTAAKHQVPAEARLAIDERIAMLYLAAYRWRDAISYAETHIIPSLEEPSEITTQMSLRDALGIAPPVWIELLGAYGRTGDIEQAARMMSRLEDACEGRAESSIWLHRGRMMFLALAGRPDAVKLLVAPKRARHMSVASRTYWLGVALQRHGDREGAGAAFQRARSRSRGRPRDLIDEEIAGLPTASAITLSPIVNQVVAKVEAAPLPAPIRLPQSHGPWVTWSLAVVLLAVAGLIALQVGSSSDPGVLVRAGALVRGRVHDGEWWRLVSCTFVHVGSVHLVVNVIGLFVLGRILEELFGSARTLAIYGGAGIAGALASYLGSPAGVSAGASGAIFGVLGAVFIELTLHRSRYRSAWKRGMWGGLLVVTLAQAGIGFLYPVIDQWAHGAGLVAGIVLGAVVSPNVRWARVGLFAGRAIALAFVAVSITAGVLVARTSIADTFDGMGRIRYDLDEVAITAPPGWVASSSIVVDATGVQIGRARELLEPDNLVIVSIQRKPSANLAADLADLEVLADRSAKERTFERLEAAPDLAIPLPTGWEGSERLAVVDDAMGQTQRWRVVMCGRLFSGEAILVLVFLPDTLAHWEPQLFSQIIGSIGPR